MPTNCTSEVIFYSPPILRYLYPKGIEYNKAGVLLNHLSAESAVQCNMFDEENRARSSALNRVLDAINKERGEGCLKYAACGFNKSWSTKFTKRTPRFTTRWEELAVAKPNPNGLSHFRVKLPALQNSSTHARFRAL